MDKTHKLLTCEECKQSYDVSKVIVWQGKVICYQCAITLVIHILDTANTKLRDINAKLKHIIDVLNHEHANR